MKIIFASIAFFIGASIGSFLHVIFSRKKITSSDMMGRSLCQECMSILKWYDLVPVFSYIILKRRCRRCKSGIPWSVWYIELLGGITLATFTWIVYDTYIVRFL